MTRGKKLMLAVALGCCCAVMFASPAAADDQSYLDGLAAAGVPINPMNSQAFLLQRGDSACRLLRAHVPPDQVAGQLGFNGWMWNQRIVEVAQRELCPDAPHP
ncbi:hypothetical protein A5739_08785 [Mycobacterium colombiense]|uniref:DUF732 domain-containing protein n=1 Tax=Mycobacterium colombiense TaxID=339268 RepID=UPI00096EC979|nr:DUF732 domain-containing protein [Mycobacterium colombiense]OMC33426.1 hypothetical protein A5739_08785 [Mycobacterium colombiense]